MNELEDIVELGSTGLISPNPESLVILNQCSFEIIEFSVNDSQQFVYFSHFARIISVLPFSQFERLLQNKQCFGVLFLKFV